jgi:predicted nucleic acid-binding protein
MLLYDTSIWVEWIIGSDFGQTFNSQFEDVSSFIVPTIVQFELQKWSQRERDEEATDQLIGFTTTCIVVPFDTSIALLAAELAQTHRLHSTDALIYATARLFGATLITSDAHFDGLPHVQFSKK